MRSTFVFCCGNILCLSGPCATGNRSPRLVSYADCVCRRRKALPRSSRLSRHERILNSLFVLYPPPISFAITSFLFASCELLAPLMFTLNGKIIVPAARLLLVTCGDYYEGFFVNSRKSGLAAPREIVSLFMFRRLSSISRHSQSQRCQQRRHQGPSTRALARGAS